MMTSAATTPTTTTFPTTTSFTTSTTTTSTTTRLPDDDCKDDASANCWGRPDEDCFGIYLPWSQAHCPLRCGFCPNRTPPCEDQIDHCQSFDPVACHGTQYRVWARINCRQYCNLCTVPTPPSDGGSQSAHWSETSPSDGAVKYACAGGGVSLAWNYVISTGVTVGDIQWFYQGHGHDKELLALTSHGHFLALPAYSGRVQATGKSGINVSGMTVADSGNYTVEVHLYEDVQAGAHTVLTRSVFVQISDDLMTQDGYLHVTQRSEAVLDTHTDKWTLELQCGTFTFRGDPAFQVEWITPAGESLASSDFQDNHFNLRLTNPVQGGNYTCRIPSQQVASTCLNGNGEHKGEATLHVDKMDARFTLLEKENEELKTSNTLLQHRLQSLEHDTLDTITSRLDKVEASSQHQAAFHATDLWSSTPPSGTPLIVTDLHYNHANAYDNDSGYFTAPYPGTYFFLATTASANDTLLHTVSLCVDDVVVSEAEIVAVTDDVHSTATVHSVVGLTAGQKVWLRGDGQEYWGPATAFSGFLVSP